MSGSSLLSKAWPSFNENNFSKFQPDSSDKRAAKKLSLYISTEDNSPEQVIKKDRSNILLRYLHQQLDKKNKNEDSVKRKAAENGEQDDTPTTSSEGEPRRKLARSSKTQPQANVETSDNGNAEN